jgi:hypothetical protein
LNLSNSHKSPEDRKPKSLRESIYDMTPIVLTVIATVLAGLSSSEMTRAQYYRAYAAQMQSKASDQWAYYQAKRMRAVEADNMLDLLRATTRTSKFDPARLIQASQTLLHAISPDQPRVVAFEADSADQDFQKFVGSPTLLAALNGSLPDVRDNPIGDDKIVHAMNAVANQQPEANMAPLLRQINPDDLTAALLTADNNLSVFGFALDPLAKTIEALRQTLAVDADLCQDLIRAAPAPNTALQAADQQLAAAQADLTASRLRFSAARYDREAHYNSVSAELYEVQVHQNGVLSDRNRRRSANFFYGMLAAQAGVVVSTMSIAVHRRSIFWTLAAAAGTVAIAFSGYIYLFT